MCSAVVDDDFGGIELFVFYLNSNNSKGREQWCILCTVVERSGTILKYVFETFK